MANRLYEHIPEVGLQVQAMVSNGVAYKTIHDYCRAEWPHEVPKHLQTFVKNYSDDIVRGKALTTSEIGSCVVRQAKDGDFNSQKFYLQSHGGWSPQTTENNRDITEDPDEAKSAIDDLANALGRNKSDNE
tara:strand:+ start:5260 stop:5652 length:393 start_codon:yes stop_codon:yes gene_type:complete